MEPVIERTSSEGESPRDLATPDPERRDGGVPSPKPYLTIRPTSGWAAINLRELWQYRDLLFVLSARDLKLRYKQTALGVIWVILQPLMAAGIFSFVFGIVAKLPSDGIPYLAFSFAGLLGWNLFNNVLSKITGSLVGNAHLISKVFFPRLILPLSNFGSCLVDFAVAGGMMALLLIVYRIIPSPLLFLLPLWLAILLAISVGLGLLSAALSVSYRDIAYILPVFTQILLYASPVAYSITAVPAGLRWIYLLNPLTPPLEAIRSSLLGTTFPGALSLLISALFGVLFLFLGLFSFKRMERQFADVI